MGTRSRRPLRSAQSPNWLMKALMPDEATEKGAPVRWDCQALLPDCRPYRSELLLMRGAA